MSFVVRTRRESRHSFQGPKPPGGTMKKLLIIAAVALGVGASATEGLAAGGASPFCQNCGNNQRGMFLFRSPMPAFQAAPWYLYWPYNAHFMTPSPLTGPYYAPPYSGGQLVNPYFPAQPA